MEPTPVGDARDMRATCAQTPFERFRDLTRKLIAVPKEELDANLAEEKARKVAPMVDKIAPQGG